jgi:LytS/YehU family sensor histidine kinase
MRTSDTAVAPGACPPGTITHPLEIIPLFRRWPRGPGRDLVYTLVWNTLLAVVFTGFALLYSANASIGEEFRVNMVFAQCIGFSIHALFVVGRPLFPRIDERPIGLRFAYYTIVPIIGVVLGYWIGARYLGYAGFVRWLLTPRGFGVVAFLSLLISAILLTIFVQRERAARAEAAVADEKARAAAAEREAVLAQLKALEAQVEPHFLYNTLAHVASLIERDSAQARRMLDRLIALLRATAKASNGAATLGGQADLLRAYLDILAMRMGPRLEWAIDVPEKLAAVELAPALLQPLVENAIKHGLEPKVEGGRVSVSAREADGALEIVVADTGAGFGRTSAPIGGSTALGLSVLKQRLQALYGSAAVLTLAENRPCGVRATLRLPLAATAVVR